MANCERPSSPMLSEEKNLSTDEKIVLLSHALEENTNMMMDLLPEMMRKTRIMEKYANDNLMRELGKMKLRGQINPEDFYKYISSTKEEALLIKRAHVVHFIKHGCGLSRFGACQRERQHCRTLSWHQLRRTIFHIGSSDGNGLAIF